jgi:hypothetical protein
VAKGEEDQAGVLLAEPHIDPGQHGLGKPDVTTDSETVLEPAGLLPEGLFGQGELVGQVVLIDEDASHITKQSAVDPNVPEFFEVEFRQPIPRFTIGQDALGPDEPV